MSETRFVRSIKIEEQVRRHTTLQTLHNTRYDEYCGRERN